MFYFLWLQISKKFGYDFTFPILFFHLCTIAHTVFTRPDYRKLAESVFFLEIPLVYGNFFCIFAKMQYYSESSVNSIHSS